MSSEVDVVMRDVACPPPSWLFMFEVDLDEGGTIIFFEIVGILSLMGILDIVLSWGVEFRIDNFGFVICVHF